MKLKLYHYIIRCTIDDEEGNPNTYYLAITENDSERAKRYFNNLFFAYNCEVIDKKDL